MPGSTPKVSKFDSLACISLESLSSHRPSVAVKASSLTYLIPYTIPIVLKWLSFLP